MQFYNSFNELCRAGQFAPPQQSIFNKRQSVKNLIDTDTLEDLFLEYAALTSDIRELSKVNVHQTSQQSSAAIVKLLSDLNVKRDGIIDQLQKLVWKLDEAETAEFYKVIQGIPLVRQKQINSADNLKKFISRL